MEKVEDKISSFVDSIIRVAKIKPDTPEKSEKLAELLAEYRKFCYENNIGDYNKISCDKGFNKIESLSYIIESVPDIFDVDEDEVKDAWNHLLEVKDSGGGISEAEAETILNWTAQKTRKVLDEICYDGGILNDSLTGACAYAQMFTLIAFIKAGIKNTVNNTSYFTEQGIRHAFGTVTFPIEKDGIVIEKQYLVDVTYRQFFTTVRCNEGRYYSASIPGEVGPDPGYYMINYYDGKEIARELLKKGYIELTPEVLKKYACSFIAGKLNINNKDQVYQIIKSANVEEFKRIIAEKQEDFDYDDDEIDKAFERVAFPSSSYKI